MFRYPNMTRTTLYCSCAYRYTTNSWWDIHPFSFEYPLGRNIYIRVYSYIRPMYTHEAMAFNAYTQNMHELHMCFFPSWLLVLRQPKRFSRAYKLRTHVGQTSPLDRRNLWLNDRYPFWGIRGDNVWGLSAFPIVMLHPFICSPVITYTVYYLQSRWVGAYLKSDKSFGLVIFKLL